MDETIDVAQLLAATKSVSTTFQGVPSDPVRVRGTAAIGTAEAGQIVERYSLHGFAVIRLDPELATPGGLLQLTSSLDLGEPFIPALYFLGGNNPASVSRISAAANAGTPDAKHPSFGRTVGQELHCDGTLQPIGYLKASVLLCECPAAEGGATTLFNASAAYSQIAETDQPAAVALATPGALVRQANINGSTDTNVGPAFTVQDDQLICGYSVTPTDRWAVPEGVDEADLLRGADLLREAALPGSRCSAQLTLGAGEAILFDNTRISHGRTSYRDSEDSRRCVYRSLHLRHPRVAVR